MKTIWAVLRLVTALAVATAAAQAATGNPIVGEWEGTINQLRLVFEPFLTEDMSRSPK